MRVALIFSYDGSQFQGSQQQKHHTHTVLNQLIDACAKLGITDPLFGSGRTDRGVHALNQVVHMDIPSFWEDLPKLHATLNRHVHPYIHIKRIIKVADDFHARFSGKMRHYRYLISHDTYQPFLANYRHFHASCDLLTCNKILTNFKGEHNFKYFKKMGSETKSDVRTIFEAKAYRHRNTTIISLKGTSFLRSQVRMMVASTLAVMDGELTEEQLKEQIAGKKQWCKKLAPAAGLYLSRIHY